MDKQLSLSLRLEFIWWIFTFILLAGVLYPILSAIDDYPFLVMNVIFVIVFVTLTRYVFLLKHTFLAYRQILKSIIIVLSIPLIFYLINEMNFFQTYIDENGMDSFLGNLPYKRIGSLGKYIRAEMLFFGTGSLIIAVITPIRMLISIWRTMNRGTV